MKKMPIVLDIETSGVDKVKCGIWQIGAYDFRTGEEYLQGGRIDDEDIVSTVGGKSTYDIFGKTEEEIRDRNKQSQKQLLQNFFGWVKARPMKNFLCQNPQFDVAFLEIKARKYGLEMPFHYRSFDLHNIAQIKYFDLNKEFLIKEDHSNMGLKNILEFCGMEDNRKAHNALEDAKLTAECFSRLLEGKNIFPEYSEYKIPKELKK